MPSRPSSLARYLTASDEPATGLDGAEVGRLIADLRRDLQSLTERLEVLSRQCAAPWLRDELLAVEGPFEGDPGAALDAVLRWLGRADLDLVAPAVGLAQAHKAAGGLASRL